MIWYHLIPLHQTGDRSCVSQYCLSMGNEFSKSDIITPRLQYQWMDWLKGTKRHSPENLWWWFEPVQTPPPPPPPILKRTTTHWTSMCRHDAPPVTSYRLCRSRRVYLQHKISSARDRKKTYEILWRRLPHLDTTKWTELCISFRKITHSNYG